MNRWKPQGQIISSIHIRCPDCHNFDLVLRNLADLALTDNHHTNDLQNLGANELADMLRWVLTISSNKLG